MSLRAGAKAFIPLGSKPQSKKSLNKNAAVFIPSGPPLNGAPAEEEPVLNGVEDEPEPEPEINSSTKKTIQYTRDQLLALRHVTPPETELARIRAAIQAIMGNIDMSSPGRTMTRGTGRSIKRGTGGKSIRPGGRKPESPMMDIEVKDLEKTENRYQVKKDVPPDEKLIRDLTSILNKLTPDNFERLLEKIVLLKIDTPARLRDAVDAVFEKALSEPAFSPTYAEFSRHLSQKLPKLTDGGEEVQFKRVLLNKCQSEFEKERSKGSEAEEGGSTEKRRMLAAIRFIGELYARSMLSSSIIKHCIEILLGDPDSPEEEKIEALCKLLTTSGRVYDEKNPENQAFLDEQFAKLVPLTKKKKGLTSRLRFMIQDLIDLRHHKWIDRRAPTVSQKKLSEIQQEFSKGGRGGAKKPVKPATPAKDADEWETVGGKRSKPRNEITSPKTRGAATSTPRASSSRAQGNTKTSEAALHPALQRTPLAAGSRNVFEGLDEDENEGEPDKKKKDKPKKEKESSKPKTQPPPKASTEKPDPEAYDRKITGLFAEYFSNKDLKDATESVSELKSQFESFASDKKDFGLHLIISKGLFDVIERKKEQQELLAQLLIKIAEEENILSKEHFSDGFTEVLNLAEDMLVDVPKFLDYVGFILGRCVLNSAVELDYLTSEGTEALTPSNRTKFATIVLKNMKEESAEKLGTLYQEASFDFSPLLPKETTLDAFFKDQDLELLLDASS